MDDDKETRKRRRRSVRNLRRQSGVLPLNLNVLDEGTELVSSEATQPDGIENQQEMYGSMWWESQEPVVKKRRRRSGIVGGMVPQTIKPVLEEPLHDKNNLSENFSNVPEVLNDIPSNFERPEFKDLETNLTCSNELQFKTIKSDLLKVKDTQDLSGSFHGFKNTAVVKLKSSEEMEVWEESESSLEKKSANFELSEFGKCAEGNANANTSHNTSDISNTSTGNCSMTNDSPASMSPDFPISPNTAIYEDLHDDSFVGTSKDSRSTKNVGKTESADTPERVECSVTQVSPGTDQVSDLSHSDKENSITTENTTLNTTPFVKDETGEKVSPGFMSMCKAFAGKVVNFVRTSPSFLTGSLIDSACASPPLQKNTKLNQESATPPTQEVPLVKLGTRFSTQKNTSETTENMDIYNEWDSNKETENKVQNGHSNSENLLSETKSTNQVTCMLGSAKKKKDRKSFIDTFNAVSEELKKDRQKSSSTADEVEPAEDEMFSSDISDVKKQDRQESGKEILSQAVMNDKLGIHSDQVEDYLLSEKLTDESISDKSQTMHSVNNDDTIGVSDVDKNKGITNNSPMDFDKSAYSEHLEKDLMGIRAVCTESMSDKSAHTNLNDNINSANEKTEILFRNVTNTFGVDDTTVNKTVVNSIIGIEEGKELQGGKVTCTAEEPVIGTIDTNDSGSKQGNADVSCQNILVKQKTKRQKRRALVVQNNDHTDILFVSTSKKDVNISESEKLVEKKQILSFDVNMAVEQGGLLLKEQKGLDSIDGARLSGRLESDVQDEGEEKKSEEKLEKVSENTDSSKNKIRKNRRKSFGFQNVGVNVENIETDCYVKKSKFERARTIDEVDGTNEEEFRLEKRVAELDLGQASAKTESENGRKFENLEGSEKYVENKAALGINERRKRGRPRKSSIVNDILKKGMPSGNITEKIQEEDENKNGNENQNMFDLTNEISQVQISGQKPDMMSPETISVESLVLPEDLISDQEQKDEPKRKRRRSADVASLRLQMMDIDQSPSSSESPKTKQEKPRRRKSADAGTLKIQFGDDSETSDLIKDCAQNNKGMTGTKIGRKRKHAEESFDELEKIYKNKNFVKPEEKKPWQTVLESPSNSVEVFGKKRLQRHIEFERPTQMKLRRRLQKAVKNGWDPKKRKRSELEDDYVQMKLESLWSELDQVDDSDPESLHNKLRSIVETA